MATPFDTAADAAGLALLATYGRPIIYRRGEDETEIDLAAKGPPRFRTAGIADTLLDWTGADWILPAAALLLDEARIDPVAGDEIDETDADGATLTWEVVPAGDEPCWRYCDPGNRLIRIHTKHTKTTPAEEEEDPPT
jgi:hypothetical protein